MVKINAFVYFYEVLVSYLSFAEMRSLGVNLINSIQSFPGHFRFKRDYLKKSKDGGVGL